VFVVVVRELEWRKRSREFKVEKLEILCSNSKLGVQSWKARVKRRAGRLNIQERQWPLSSVKHGKSDLGCRRAPDHGVTAQSTQRPREKGKSGQ
jgi:hypothetical protein